MPKEYTRDNILYIQDAQNRIVLQDNFSDTPFKFYGSGTGVGWVCARNTTYAFTGSASMIMSTRTPGDTNGDQVNAYSYFAVQPGASSVRFGFQFMSFNTYTLWEFQAQIIIDIPPLRHTPVIRCSAGNWTYRDSAGVFQNLNLPTILTDPSIPVWHSIALTVTLPACNYNTVSLDSQQVTFPVNTASLSGPVSSPGSFIYFGLTTLQNVMKTCYIDEINTVIS